MFLRIETNLPFINYTECNGLEEPIEPLLTSEPLVVSDEGKKFFTASFTPFQVKSFLLSFWKSFVKKNFSWNLEVNTKHEVVVIFKMNDKVYLYD